MDRKQPLFVKSGAKTFFTLGLRLWSEHLLQPIDEDADAWRELPAARIQDGERRWLRAECGQYLNQGARGQVAGEAVQRRLQMDALEWAYLNMNWPSEQAE